MPPISILHAPRDEALGEKIAAALASAGHAATRVAGDAGDFTLEAAHEGAAIVVWTEAAAKLVRLRDQALEAMARGALIPVAVGRVRPPGGFEQLPPVDLSGWTGAVDDPRWRFVLEEIRLAEHRSLLRDGSVWGPAENDPAPPAEADDAARDDDVPGVPVIEPYTDEIRAVRPARPRRRFSARAVAYGATGVLIVMTVATALLAPVLLPGPEPVTQTEPDKIAGAADAGPIAAAAPETSEETGNVETLEIPPAIDAALDVNDAPADLASADAPASATAPTAVVADSDAMENLIASVTAAASDDARPEFDPLPDDVTGVAYLGNFFKECAECPDMAALPAGSFTMGAAAAGDRTGAEGPAVEVTLSKRFAIGTREVTFAQWDACVADGGCARAPSDYGWGRGKQPVVSVSYDDALAYVAWLSKKTGHAYRLPTEAEWEYAARAGSSSPFAFGEAVTTDQANFNGKYPYRGKRGIFRQRTTPAASFPPNAFGLFDMHGNVWEWTEDCWTAGHQSEPANGAAVISGDCAKRVLKGGAWNTGAWRLRAAHRIGKSITAREFDNGFRVARDLD